MKLYIFIYLLFLALNSYTQSNYKNSIFLFFDDYSVLKNDCVDYDTLDLIKYIDVVDDYVFYQLMVLNSDSVFLNFISGFENDTLRIFQKEKVVENNIISTDLSRDEIFVIEVSKKDFYGKKFSIDINNHKYEIPIIQGFRIINIDKDSRGNLILTYNNNP